MTDRFAAEALESTKFYLSVKVRMLVVNLDLGVFAGVKNQLKLA